MNEIQHIVCCLVDFIFENSFCQFADELRMKLSTTASILAVTVHLFLRPETLTSHVVRGTIDKYSPTV